MHVRTLVYKNACVYAMLFIIFYSHEINKVVHMYDEYYIYIVIM